MKRGLASMKDFTLGVCADSVGSVLTGAAYESIEVLLQGRRIYFRTQEKGIRQARKELEKL